jgi:hypothetical protein
MGVHGGVLRLPPQEAERGTQSAASLVDQSPPSQAAKTRIMDSTVIDVDEIGVDAARAKLGIIMAPDSKATTATTSSQSSAQVLHLRENSTVQMGSMPPMATQKSQGANALQSLQSQSSLPNNAINANRRNDSMVRSMSEALNNSPLMKPTFFAAPLDASNHLKSRLSTSLSAEQRLSINGVDKLEKEAVAEEPPSQDVGFMTRAYNTLQVVKTVTLSSPMTVIGIPFFFFILLAALGIYGTLAGAAAYSQNLKDAANSAAVDTSTSFTLSVQQTFAPLLTLATYIQLSPDYTTVLPKFVQIADVLLSKLPNGTISTLQFSPYGVIRGGEMQASLLLARIDFHRLVLTLYPFSIFQRSRIRAILA